MGVLRRQRQAATVAGVVALGIALSTAIGAPAFAAGLVGARAASQADRGTATVEATAAKLDNGAGSAQLAFAMTKHVDATSYTMANPDRVIVDLPQVAFSLDPQVGAPKGDRRHRSRKGLISSFRFGLLAPGRSRIVIDLAQPARIAAAAVRTVDGQPRLVVELARTSRAAFLASAAAGEPATAVAVPVPVAVPQKAAAETVGKATIVIDPGHGGPDMGAMVNGVVEKDVTLAFARMLADKLEANGRFNVVMTRANDVFVPLSERVQVARSAAAALMISIHADTLPETTDVAGATVYTVSDKASDAYAAKVALKENEADAAVGLDGKTDTAEVNDILFDLTRQETRAYSHVFARTLVNYWKVAGRLNKNPQRAAGFVVLKAPDVPSVLLELGYLSNPGDAASLTSPDWRAAATARMAEAIDTYFAAQRGAVKPAAEAGLPALQASAAQSGAK